MRKILFLLCILSITIGAKAQLFGKHWSEGSYYDLAGVKHTGFVSWEAPEPSFLTGPGDQIYYKPKKKSDNIKLKSTEIKGFIIGADSFVVSQYNKLEKKPFISVLARHDTTTLYSSMTTRSSPMAGMGGMGGLGTGVHLLAGVGFSYNKAEYFYGPDQNHLTKLDKKHFIEVMSKVTEDRPEIVDRIKTKILRLGDMADIMVLYRTGQLPPGSAPDPFSGSNN